MSFYADVSGGVEKLRVATHLGEFVRTHQLTKNLLNYVHTNSDYGHIVEITSSETQESFSRSAKEKLWVEEIILCLSGGKE